MTLSQQQLRQEIKNGPSGAYLFYGDEDYLKSFYSARIKKSVLGDDSDSADWNSYSVSPADDGSPSLDDLCEAAAAVPLMGGRIFIQYKVNIAALSDEDSERLLSIIRDIDGEVCILVIVCPQGGFDKNSKKPTKRAGEYEKSAKLVELSATSLADTRKWIDRRFFAESLTITPSAKEALFKRCSDKMQILSGELDKLTAYAKANSITEITENEVQFVTSVTEEEEAFALANAILDGDRRRALSILHIHKTQRDKPLMVLAGISRSITDMLTVSCLMAEGAGAEEIARKTKMHKYRVSLYMNAVRESPPERLIAAANRCRRADLLLKSTSLEYIALERLVCTLPAKRRGAAR